MVPADSGTRIIYHCLSSETCSVPIAGIVERPVKHICPCLFNNCEILVITGLLIRNTNQSDTNALFRIPVRKNECLNSGTRKEPILADKMSEVAGFSGDCQS